MIEAGEQPKEGEPTQAAEDASAQAGEGAESPAPGAPAATTTVPATDTSGPPRR
jgi:hypothetical protein